MHYETLVEKLPSHLNKSVVEACIEVAADLHKNGLPESKSRDGVYPGDHHGFSIVVGNTSNPLASCTQCSIAKRASHDAAVALADLHNESCVSSAP